MNSEYNDYLITTPIVGFDYQGQKVEMQEPEIVNLMQWKKDLKVFGV